MKKLFYLLFFCVLYSCSSEDSTLIIENDLPTLRAKAHPNYKELGWGIDLTGDYLTLEAVKAPVIDVSKFVKHHHYLLPNIV